MASLALEEVEALLVRLEVSGVDGDREALMQLWELGPEAVAGVPALCARLGNDASPLRELAVRWLGHFGIGSAVAAAAVADAMRADDAELRGAAIIAAGDLRVASDAIVAGLTGSLRSDDALHRVWAARSLLLLVPSEPAPLEVLRAARASSDYRVRDGAASSRSSLRSSTAARSSSTTTRSAD